MVVHKRWEDARGFHEGWYLFGFIPLYIRGVSWNRYCNS